jgi:hypothetical protein
MRYARVAVAAVSILAVSGFASAAAAGSDSESPVPSHQLSEEPPAGVADPAVVLASQLSLDEDEVRARMDRVPAVSELQTAAQNALGDDFAGLWVDQNDGSVHVASAAPRPAEFAELSDVFPYPDLLRFTVVDQSLADLESMQADVTALDIPGSAEIDIPSNGLTFVPSEPLTDEGRQRLHDSFGAGIDISDEVVYQVTTATRAGSIALRRCAGCWGFFPG